MDEATQKYHDQLVEDEVARGYRLKKLPPEIVKLLEMVHEENQRINVFDHIRFERLTPRGKARVGEITLIRFNEDMNNPNLVGYDKLREMNIVRGAWSQADDDKIKELHLKSSTEMQNLYIQGFDKEGQWMEELAKQTDLFMVGIKTLSEEVQTKVSAVLSRWLNFIPEKQAEYDIQFAAEQGIEHYSPDKDYLWLTEQGPDDKTVDALMETEILKEKLIKLGTIITIREELNVLIDKKAKIFGTSVEARREKTAEMAQLYFGTKIVDERGKPISPLVPEFDDLWDLPDGVIEWLLTEAYFFYEGVPDETKRYLQAWGFIRAERDSGSKKVLDESPVPQDSKNDATPVDGMHVSSLELEPAKS